MATFDGLDVEYDCEFGGCSNGCAIPVHGDCEEKMEIDEEENKCVICACRIEDLNRFITICAHEYHMKCLKQWAEHQQRQNRPPPCPTCRTRLQPCELTSLDTRIAWVNDTMTSEETKETEAEDAAEEAVVRHNVLMGNAANRLPLFRIDGNLILSRTRGPHVPVFNVINIASSSDEDDDDYDDEYYNGVE
jgi:hypothetical protein